MFATVLKYNQYCDLEKPCKILFLILSIKLSEVSVLVVEMIGFMAKYLYRRDE